MSLKPNTFLLVTKDMSRYSYVNIQSAIDMTDKKLSVKAGDVIIFQGFKTHDNLICLEVIDSNCQTIFIRWTFTHNKIDINDGGKFFKVIEI